MTANKTVLSSDARQAVEQMIKITNNLILRIEHETNALGVNDGTEFSLNEMEKEQSADIYHQAAAEFHGRLSEFKKVDKDLLAKLEKAQHSLKSSTKSNIGLLESLQNNN